MSNEEPVPVLFGLEQAPALVLPHADFAYAGQYRMRRYGKAVLTRQPSRPTQPESIIAAVSTDRHRRHRDRLVVRTVDVRRELRGRGWGPSLLVSLLPVAQRAGYRTIQIHVNNPFAYIAVSKAGFAWAGRSTGLAELVMTRPTDRPATTSRGRFAAGLSMYRRRRPTPAARRAIARYRRGCVRLDAPPAVDEMIPAGHATQQHG